MKVTIMRMFKILCLLLPVLLFMLLIPFRSSDDLIRIRDYYREEEDSLDVVFLGASEVFAGFSSALAYGEYGFTSYPYSLSSNYIDLYPVQLEEIYRTQNPKLVVVDISPMMRSDVPENADAIFRNYIERVPVSGNKIRAVRTFGDREHLLSYYIPFMMYHGSETPGKVLSLLRDEYDALNRGYGYLKGTITCTTRSFQGDLIPLNDAQKDRKAELSELADTKLRAFLEDCREKGYENILFAAFPHRIGSEYAVYRCQLFNGAREIIESYGYDLLNLERLSDEIGIDQELDYYNDDHLNIHGQRKLTRYLSRQLVETYGVTPQPQTQENRGRWDNSYNYIQRYYAYAERLMEEQPQVENWIWEENWQISAIGKTELPTPAN